MEVHIDASGQAAPDDTFISMRIGDVQKQSRFAASRTYRFPDPGNKGGATYGRLEIFQRVGHVTLSLDGSQPQSVEVPCQFAQGSYQIGLQVTAKGAPAAHITSNDKKKSTRQRLDAAQEYLDNHRLEEMLADVMREVIHHKPKDPHSFISDQIIQRSSSGNNGGFLPKIAGAHLPKNEMKESWSAAPPPAPEPVFKAQEQSAPLGRPLSRGETSSKKLPPLSLGNEPGRKSPPLVQQVNSVKATSVPLSGGSFGQYYSAHIESLPDSSVLTIHSKFQAFNQSQERALMPATSTTPSSSAFSKLPSTGTWLMKLPATRKPVPISMQLKTSPSEFSKLPSTGTWLMTLPATRKPVPISMELKTSPSEFSKLPSTGTWLIKRLSTTDRAETYQTKVETGPYNKLPSVGTWLSPLSSKKKAELGFTAATPSPAPDDQVFRLRPSVGTWLTRVPPKVERPWYYQEYLGADSELVHKMQEVICDKDKELAELKAHLKRLGIEIGLEGHPAQEETNAPGRSPPPAAPAPKVEAVSLSGGSFGQYYKAYFKLQSAPAIVEIYKKFPKFVKSTEASVGVETPSGPEGLQVRALPLEFKQSNKGGESVPLSSASFDQYYKAHFKIVSSSSACAIHSKFAKFVKAGETSANGFNEIQASSSDLSRNFNLQPSVGSWLAPAPFRAKQKEGSASEVRPSNLSRNFSLQPSVGSWLAPRPFRSKQKEDPVEVPQRGLDKAAASFRFQPSVGSWLQKAPKIESSSILDRRPSELERMDKTALIAGFRAELEKRDRQIESLKH